MSNTPKLRRHLLCASALTLVSIASIAQAETPAPSAVAPTIADATDPFSFLDLDPLVSRARETVEAVARRCHPHTGSAWSQFSLPELLLLTERLSRDLCDGLALGLEAGTTPLVSVRSVGGAVNDVPADATAYAHRHQNFDVGSVGREPAAFHRHWDSLRPLLDGLYTSFETDTRPERLHDAFPGETLTRLRALKAAFDPDNVFDQNFPIEPPPSSDRPA